MKKSSKKHENRSYDTEAVRHMKGETDFERLDAMDDAAIQYDDIPEPDQAFWENAEVVLPQTKQGVYIRLDQDVLEWFKSHGPGYQTRINAVLKSYVEHHR